MTTVLNWDLREHMHLFREEPGEGREIRLDVLINLILHANLRGRTWVSRDRIAREIGAAEARVSAALKWLFQKGAIYNVPFKYRIGEERDLEPRKYVFQLTGIIRFNGELVVPYLYLPNLESEIANTLRELADIGGEALVDFLTQGSESEHLVSGQGSESNRSESNRSESEHKGSTDSKGHTVKDSSYRAPEGPRQVEGELDSYLQIPNMWADREDRQGEKHASNTDDGEEEIVEEATDYTPFETWMLAACYNTKSLSEKQRKNFHQRMPYLDSDRKTATSPTVNEAWDTDPAYQAFVRDVILLEIQGRRQLHPTGFHQTLNSKKTWERFYAWRDVHGDEYDSHAGDKQRDGRLVMQPDGSEKWVPYDEEPLLVTAPMGWVYLPDGRRNWEVLGENEE